MAFSQFWNKPFVAMLKLLKVVLTLTKKCITCAFFFTRVACVAV